MTTMTTLDVARIEWERRDHPDPTALRYIMALEEALRGKTPAECGAWHDWRPRVGGWTCRVCKAESDVESRGEKIASPYLAKCQHEECGITYGNHGLSVDIEHKFIWPPDPGYNPVPAPMGQPQVTGDAVWIDPDALDEIGVAAAQRRASALPNHLVRHIIRGYLSALEYSGEAITSLREDGPLPCRICGRNQLAAAHHQTELPDAHDWKDAR